MILQWGSEFDAVQMSWLSAVSVLLLFTLLPACALLFSRGQFSPQNGLRPDFWLKLLVLHSCLWVIVVYSLTFGPSAGTTPHSASEAPPLSMEATIQRESEMVDERHLMGRGGVIGDLQFAGFRTLEAQGNAEEPLFASRRPHHSVTQVAFLTFHLSVYLSAVMTVAAIATAGNIGSLKSSILSIIWGVLVYAPVMHWVWGEGWLGVRGAMDLGGSLYVLVLSSSVLGFRCVKRPAESNDPDLIALEPWHSLGTAGFVIGLLLLMSTLSIPSAHLRSVAVLNGLVAMSSGGLIAVLLPIVIPVAAKRLSIQAGVCSGISAVAAGGILFDSLTSCMCGALGAVTGMLAGSLAAEFFHRRDLRFPTALAAASAFGMLAVGVFGSSTHGIFHSDKSHILSLIHGETTLLQEQVLASTLIAAVATTLSAIFALFLIQPRSIVSEIASH